MAFLVPHLCLAENFETVNGSNTNGILDVECFNNTTSHVQTLKYDSTDDSELTVPSPAALQTNHTSKQEVLPGSKRILEEEDEDSESIGSVPNPAANHYIDSRIEAEDSYNRGNDIGGTSIEAKLDSALMKVLKKPSESENYHELFFRSLIPMMSRLDDVETVEFRSEVLGILLKYLKRQRRTSQLDDSTSS